MKNKLEKILVAISCICISIYSIIFMYKRISNICISLAWALIIVMSILYVVSLIKRKQNEINKKADTEGEDEKHTRQ